MCIFCLAEITFSKNSAEQEVNPEIRQVLHEIKSLITDRTFDKVRLAVWYGADAYRVAALMAVGHIKSILEPRTRLDVFASVKCDAGQSSKAGGNFTFSPLTQFPKRENGKSTSRCTTLTGFAPFLKSS